MRLVGEMKIQGADWDLDGFGRLFSRLRAEVKHAGDLTRFVGYASEPEGVRFLGIEVERIADIPEEMVGWELGSHKWRVIEPGERDCTKLCLANLTWSWRDESSIQRTTGGFTAECPSEWCSRETGSFDFQPTANAYFAPGKEGSDDGIYLVDYDPSWPERFGEMAAWVQEALGPEIALRIEHYGSTAIPGMPAKPVIDILVEIPSFVQARPRVIPLFNTLDWEYWWYSGHMFFGKRKEFMGVRTHHIHMAPAGHEIWNGLAFRDFLCTHQKEASEYAALKYQLASAHQSDRERYTLAKSEFVREVTARALEC